MEPIPLYHLSRHRFSTVLDNFDNQLVVEDEIFQTVSKRAPFRETGQAEKNAKKKNIFTRNSTENLVLLPTRTSLKILNFMILRPLAKTFPPEMKPRKRGKMGKEEQKKRGGEKVKSKSRGSSETFQAQNFALCACPSFKCWNLTPEIKAGLSLDLQKTFWTELVLFGYIMTRKWLYYLQIALICQKLK